MGKFDSFVALKNFIQGKIDSYELMNSIPKINKVEVNYDDLSKSIIVYDFERESDLLKLIGVSDDDIWFYDAVTSPYGSYSIYTTDTSETDFYEGYGIWDELDDDNWDKLKTISNFIMKKPFSQDTDFLSEFAVLLNKLFPKEVRSMITDYAQERDNQMTDSATRVIENDLDDYFSQVGVKFTNGLLKIEIGKLFDQYVSTGKLTLSLEKILENFLKSDYTPEGGWGDSTWEYQESQGFDTERFNRYVENNLDSILEKIMENEEQARRFLTMIQRIEKKFRPNVLYDLPKEKFNSVKFSIQGYDYPTQTIIVKLRKDLKQKEFKMTEENFYNLLYQPELFKIGELHNL